MPPKIKQIAEVALVVSDLERSRRFYQEVLGLEEFHWDKMQPGAGIVFHIGNGYIGLWLPGAWPRINPHLGPAEDLGRRAHVVLSIDHSEVEAGLETLRKHNVRFWGPRYGEGGEVHIDFEDPDGHMLEFLAKKI